MGAMKRLYDRPRNDPIRRGYTAFLQTREATPEPEDVTEPALEKPPGRPRILQGCNKAINDLPKMIATAKSRGITVKVSWPSTGTSVFMYVMFNRKKHRLADYWPSCKKLRLQSGETRLVDSSHAALQVVVGEFRRKPASRSAVPLMTTAVSGPLYDPTADDGGCPF